MKVIIWTDHWGTILDSRSHNETKLKLCSLYQAVPIYHNTFGLFCLRLSLLFPITPVVLFNVSIMFSELMTVSAAEGLGFSLCVLKFSCKPVFL